ncbi:MAG: Helix-turn-helix domain protein [Candidatus Methanoperedenaceae archaeon GB50]|nr:MAG: Helix-turn-helix domain protein [Candidatus Methanoperedenaceae archaeon GB50]
MGNIKKRLLTVKEVAQYLGVSEPTVWVLLRKGVLKRIKVGGATRIDKIDLDKFIENQK